MNPNDLIKHLRYEKGEILIKRPVVKILNKYLDRVMDVLFCHMDAPPSMVVSFTNFSTSMKSFLEDCNEGEEKEYPIDDNGITIVQFLAKIKPKIEILIALKKADQKNENQ